MTKRTIPSGSGYAQTSAYNVELHDTEERFSSQDVEGALIEIDDHINVVEDTTTALGGRLDSAEEAITALDGRLDTVETDVDTVTTEFEAYTIVRYDDIVFEATPTRINPTTSKPDYDYTNNGFLFPRNDTSEKVSFTVQLPHRWKEGTNVYPHIHIRQNQALQCVFKVDYQWYNLGEAIPVAQTHILNSYAVPYTSGTISQVVKNDTPLSGVGKKISSFLKVTLYRDDNVYVGDVFVDQFDIHIQVDNLGSAQQFIKEPA